MSNRERKRTNHEEKARPLKKTAVRQEPSEVVKVSLPQEDEWAPIVVSTPGLSLPRDLHLKPYKRRRNGGKSNVGKTYITSSEHLLHTSAHSKIDYIAREEEGGSDSLLSHYLGVYDPESGQLQLVRARKLVLRGKVRPIESTEEIATKPENSLSARNTLGLTFGTKKSQKAIEALTKNAISPLKARRLTAGQTKATLDPIASAVVSSMAATTSMPTREELQAAVDESKPRPQPNLDAETPADVYPIDKLVGREALRQMITKEWQDAVEAGEEIFTKSRFVSHRIQSIVSSNDIRRLKTLKYLLLLLEWYNVLHSPSKLGGRNVPKPEHLHAKLEGWSSFLVDGVTHRFTDQGARTVTRWHLDNLITHICALAVIVDGFATDVYDLMQDLKLEMKDMRKYYREIGCQAGPPTEAEMRKMGIGKAEGKGRVVARLKLPLEFPKMRVMRARRK